jgi:hypothetical protein
MAAELDGAICSGPRHGRHLTYALLSRRAPRPAEYRADEALARLTQRYFSSHGPATLKDFAWWSGLTQRDGRRGVEINSRTLTSDTLDGLTYWRCSDEPPLPRWRTSTYLLPNYDEALVAYQDRGLSAPVAGTSQPRDEFAHRLLVDGKVAGTWRRLISARRAVVSIHTYRRPDAELVSRLEKAGARYGRFLGVDADVRIISKA